MLESKKIRLINHQHLYFRSVDFWNVRLILYSSKEKTSPSRKSNLISEFNSHQGGISPPFFSTRIEHLHSKNLKFLNMIIDLLTFTTEETFGCIYFQPRFLTEIC